MTEHDEGFRAGSVAAANECMRLVTAHIGRLEPGKSQRVRDALLALEASMRSVLFAQARLKEYSIENAARYTWLRERYSVLTRMEPARELGLDLARVYVNSAEKFDAVVDAAMARNP